MSEALTKNYSSLCILKILQDYSSVDNPLRQSAPSSASGKPVDWGIAEYLERDYGIVLERKAIGRIVNKLKTDFGVHIDSNRKGCWIVPPENELVENSFADLELSLLVNSIRSNKYISEDISANLVNKLNALFNSSQPAGLNNVIVMDGSNKSENSELLHNVEIIDRAISDKKLISFNYFSHFRDELVRDSREGEHTLAPVALVFMNGRYYMVTLSKSEAGSISSHNSHYYALDKMTAVSIIEASEVKSSLSAKQAQSLKKMAALDEPMSIDQKRIRFYAPSLLIHKIQETFGKDVSAIARVHDGSDNNETMLYADYMVDLDTSEASFMPFWRQNMVNIVMLHPQNMVDKFMLQLKKAEKLNSNARNSLSVKPEDMDDIRNLSFRSRIALGAPLEFGSYVYNEKGDTRPIEWLFIKKDSVKALLVTKDYIDVKENRDVSGGSADKWNDCTLRSWLNNEFYNTAFTDEEKRKLLKTEAGDAVEIIQLEDMVLLEYAMSIRNVECTEYALHRLEECAAAGVNPDVATELSSADTSSAADAGLASAGSSSDVQDERALKRNAYRKSMKQWAKFEYDGKQYVKGIDGADIISLLEGENLALGIRPAIWVRL